MARETTRIELDSGVVAEMLTAPNSRIRMEFNKAAAREATPQAGAIVGIEAILPLMLVTVTQGGESLNAKSLFEWLLDHTDTLDPLVRHASEAIGRKADPNASSGSPSTPEPATESRPQTGSDTSIVASSASAPPTSGT